MVYSLTKNFMWKWILIFFTKYRFDWTPDCMNNKVSDICSGEQPLNWNFYNNSNEGYIFFNTHDLLFLK